MYEDAQPTAITPAEMKASQPTPLIRSEAVAPRTPSRLWKRNDAQTPSVARTVFVTVRSRVQEEAHPPRTAEEDGPWAAAPLARAAGIPMPGSRTKAFSSVERLLVGDGVTALRRREASHTTLFNLARGILAMPRKKQTPVDTTLSNYTVYTARDEVDRDFGEVVLYSASWCRHGEELRRYFDNHHVIHAYKDCEDPDIAEEAAKIVEEINSRFKSDVDRSALPVVRIKDRSFVRPTIPELEKVLLIEDTQARELFDVVVIGGGLSGTTAVRHSARLGLKSILLERNIILGKLGDLPWIARTESYPEGVEGRELAAQIRLDLEDNSEAVIVEGVNVKRLKRVGGLFEVSTDGAIYRTKSVILATGAVPGLLGAAGELSAHHRGLYYDPAHEREAGREKSCFVFGADLETYREALAIDAKDLLIIDPRRTVELPGPIAEELRIRGVELQHDCRVLEVRREGARLEAIKYVNEQSHKTYLREVEVGFVRLPNGFETRWLAPAISLDDSGRILATDLRTSWDGVFAIGDCTKRSDTDPEVSLHEGAVAADRVVQFLRGWTLQANLAEAKSDDEKGS